MRITIRAYIALAAALVFTTSAQCASPDHTTASQNHGQNAANPGWGEFLDLINATCEFLPCYVMSTAEPETREQAMQAGWARATGYLAFGLLPNLTSDNRIHGLATLERLERYLAQAPDNFDPTLLALWLELIPQIREGLKNA